MASNGDNTERVISSNQDADRCVEMEDAENKGKYCYGLASKMLLVISINLKNKRLIIIPIHYCFR